MTNVLHRAAEGMCGRTVHEPGRRGTALQGAGWGAGGDVPVERGRADALSEGALLVVVLCGLAVQWVLDCALIHAALH